MVKLRPTWREELPFPCSCECSAGSRQLPEGLSPPNPNCRPLPGPWHTPSTSWGCGCTTSGTSWKWNPAVSVLLCPALVTEPSVLHPTPPTPMADVRCFFPCYGWILSMLFCWVGGQATLFVHSSVDVHGVASARLCGSYCCGRGAQAHGPHGSSHRLLRAAPRTPKHPVPVPSPWNSLPTSFPVWFPGAQVSVT